MIYYLAYGSNLHPVRLTERVSSTKYIAVVELQGYGLSFSKRSKDRSGKCTITETTGEESVLAALYSITSEQMPALDGVEGLGYGYERKSIKIKINSIEYEATTYTASSTHVDETLKPYHWYKGFVEEGAKYHNFPASYVERISSTESIDDPDKERRAQNEALLAELKNSQATKQTHKEQE